MKRTLLNGINVPTDIKKYDVQQLNALSEEIRARICETTFKNGGHLASNLGVVELTIALHYVFDAPRDKIFFDVGHQSYTHKLLTGRNGDFDKLRTLDGISGFTRRSESCYDASDSGHSSSALSLACGLAQSGYDGRIIALVGDGAMTGGLFYEAFNTFVRLQQKVILILNDNDMSISRNDGFGAAFILAAKSSCVDIRFFEIEDGHDISQLISVLIEVKSCPTSCVVHVKTIKGKGLCEAESDPTGFHGVTGGAYTADGVYKIGNGTSLKTQSFSDVLGETLSELADKDERIFAITAAMADGTGLTPFKSAHPDRFIDCEIAEAHAAATAAGLALGGAKAYFAVYSTFLQRAYDCVLQDVCIQNLPVTLCLDRAGLVGGDGITHQGIYDVAILRPMPHLKIFAPKDIVDFRAVLTASTKYDFPFAIRYPKGGTEMDYGSVHGEISVGKWEILNESNGDFDCVLLAFGATAVEQAVLAARICGGVGVKVMTINAMWLKPLDTAMLDAIRDAMIFTIEDNLLAGGFGEAVNAYYGGSKTITSLGIRDGETLTHASVEELLKICGLDAESIAEKICAACKIS